MSEYFIHITGPADRWDHIAYRYYGDATRYSEIIAANRAMFLDLQPIPTTLPPGLSLKVPIVEARNTLNPEDVPPWKR